MTGEVIDSPRPDRLAPSRERLSVAVPVLHQGDVLPDFLTRLAAKLQTLDAPSEILVVSADARDASRIAETPGARFIQPTGGGYGRALAAGFAAATGEYIATVDADLAGDPEFIRDLWRNRDAAEIVVASRYVAGGRADLSPIRRAGSRSLNALFRLGLSLPLSDLSSGFRLYRRNVVTGYQYSADDFDILQEILVRAFAEGYRVLELPFTYASRARRGGVRRHLRMASSALRTFYRLWRLRNSILAADYDARAHDSAIWLQRYWQRSRYRHVTDLIAGEGAVLDVGCGSSRIIGALPPGSVAVDILRRKLRYAARYNRWRVEASGFNLPFPDASFPCVLCSQVIEHVPKESPILSELRRVLKPGGRLVLGTPDYDHWEWVMTEKLYGWAAPGGYADEHIAHYSYRELEQLFAAHGYTCEASRYILRGELIIAFRKPT